MLPAPRDPHADDDRRTRPRPDRPASHLARLADFSFRRRRVVVAAWVAVLVVAVLGGGALRGEWSADYSTPGSESRAAVDLLSERFPERSTDSVDVVWQAEAGAQAPDVRERMDAFIRDASALDGVGDSVPAARADVSPDGTVAVARLPLTTTPGEVPLATGEELIAMADERSGDGLRVELGGQAVGNAQRGEISSETIGFAFAALVLLVTFGSVVASGLPLATALFGLGVSSALVGVLAAVVDTPDWAASVAAMIGIGVGIDYALLILTRFRGGLHRGLDARAATVEAIATAGRSVLVAGTTVVISVLGLFVVGLPYLYGVALAAITAVLVVMAGAVTLLPALLGFARERVNRLRIPFTGRTPADPAAAPAARWSRAVQRRPWTAAIAGVLVLVALAAPVTGLRIAYPDQGNDAAGTTTREAYELVTRGFGPGAAGPLVLAAEVDDRAAIDALPAELARVPGVAAVSPPAFNRAGDAAVLTVTPTTSPQDTATEALVDRLRGMLPAQVSVGGATAQAIDQSEATASRLPLFIGVVVGLSLLLLLVAFRSLAVALKAGVMNLLSVGTAYGVVALVAEGGWAGQLVGIDTATPVPPFIPVIMFAVLFGLSMDYEVFLLSRVREAFDAGRDTAGAVTEGLTQTARVITAAAAIMVAVFGAFALSDQVFLVLIGIGMASAILVDATVVRMVLVPAVMQILGERSWWLPRWLDRLIPQARLAPA
ncbi:MAG: MMPL family transporter [Solirubrobacteraceae bacterium]